MVDETGARVPYREVVQVLDVAGPEAHVQRELLATAHLLDERQCLGLRRTQPGHDVRAVVLLRFGDAAVRVVRTETSLVPAEDPSPVHRSLAQGPLTPPVLVVRLAIQG